MKLSVCHTHTTFSQDIFHFGFATYPLDRPNLRIHVLTPDLLAGDAAPGYRKGTIMVYVVDFTGKDIFTPKEMLHPSREMIDALRAQWSELSAEFIRHSTERLDNFEEEEGVSDYDARSNIQYAEISFDLAKEFFQAPDYQIAPTPQPGTMGFLISASPMPPP